MNQRNKILLTVILAVLLAASVYALLASRQIIHIGKIEAVGVGVYWDSACTQNCTAIDWGLIAPGSSAARTIFVRNEGNVPGTLSLTAQDWNPPSAANFLSLSWNFSGTIQPQQVVPIELTLTVSADVSEITDFSFTSIIQVVA
jgi:hypothetical protein